MQDRPLGTTWSKRTIVGVPREFSLVGGLLYVVFDRSASRRRSRFSEGKFVIAGAVPDRARSDLKKPWLAIQRHAGWRASGCCQQGGGAGMALVRVIEIDSAQGRKL